MSAAARSACFASLALVAVDVFGVLNLRRARRGPTGKPSWRFERTETHREGVWLWTLTNTVDMPAFGVRLSFAGRDDLDTKPARQLFRCDPGHQVVTVPYRSRSAGGPVVSVRVQYRDRAGSEQPPCTTEVSLPSPHMTAVSPRPTMPRRDRHTAHLARQSPP